MRVANIDRHNSNKMTVYARAGYAGQHMPALYSSAAWMAQEGGDWMRENGYLMPGWCQMSRGYSVRMWAGNSVFVIKFTEDKRGILSISSVVQK